MEITLGALYTVKTSGDGRFVATVDRFEQDGNVAVLIPTQAAVRDVFPNGYRMVRGLWASGLKAV